MNKALPVSVMEVKLFPQMVSLLTDSVYLTDTHSCHLIMCNFDDNNRVKPHD